MITRMSLVRRHGDLVDAVPPVMRAELVLIGSIARVICGAGPRCGHG